jgi:hypothetical protein
MTDQSDGAGVGVGVGVTVADGGGEGDSPAVGGVGEGMNWRGSIVLAVVGVAAAVSVCAPAFVFAPVFVPLRACVPVCGATGEVPLKPLCPVGALVGAPGGLLPLVRIRGVCARLNVTVAMQIAITPSLIELIWVI